jgi:mannosyltransferase
MLASVYGGVHGSRQELHPKSGLSTPFWLRLALLFVLLFAFGVRLQELTRQDIWWDEARNIDVALRPFWQIPTASELDIQPPVYYWLLHGWSGLFGVTMGQPAAALALFSRLLSVFAGVCGVALLFALARRTLPADAGVAGGMLAALVGACSPFWLAESQEARMYTVGFAFASAAAIVLLRFVGTQERQGWSRLRACLPLLAIFVLLSTAALLTHYNMVFVLAAWYAWWAVWALLRVDRWQQLGVLAGCGLAMVLLTLPMAPIALRQIPDYENPNITLVTGAEYLQQNWQAYIGGYAFDPAMLAGFASWWLWLVLLLAGAGIATAAYTLWRHRHGAAQIRESFVRLSFLLAWLAGALALYYLAVLDRNAFNVRYAGFVTPALYALLGIGLAALAYVWKPLPWLGAALLVVGLVPAQQADLYDSRFDREHISEVADWLKANTQPGDAIFVDQKYPFGFYWPAYVIANDEESANSPAGTAPARYLFVDINTIDRRLGEWAADARRVFWLRWFESDTDPRHAVPFLLDKYGKFAGEQLFQGYTLQWWDMTGPGEFALAPNLEPARYAFPPAVETVAISLPQESLRPGDPLPVAIRWQRTPGGAVDRPLKARVALYDGNDARLVQADERLLNDRHRSPAQWQPHDQPLNVYMLPLPADVAPGTYTLRLLVYDADTLEPLTLVDDAANPAGQEATLGTIEVETP